MNSKLDWEGSGDWKRISGPKLRAASLQSSDKMRVSDSSLRSISALMPSFPDQNTFAHSRMPMYMMLHAPNMRRG